MRLTPQIRLATIADAEMLAALAARTFYYAFADMNTPENMQAYMAKAFTIPQLTAELSDPQARFLIAEVDGVPAGYAKLLAGAPPACVSGAKPIELVRLYVDQNVQGSGVAGDLMQACLDEARSLGHRTIYLGVWEHNHRAQAFYFRWNFRVIGSHIFQMGSDPQLDWLMERDL
ncbi:MAG TPA: GNAT family N-acetyltransferase [Blastocatellia bacterium]|nr:GNAT family N-acetyltransferase [Blastocatellia bacterium]HMV85415.1 GNAT family N-acetyltransferase [Blastocatellia bacterium]HMX29456.1 GNAT family N-acetyltransferase [Blastocatellia bacterium]HMY71532.1 GNAT family N-acetyltransferase [Blastocatellia bacterium]HMZ16443.1 GNAT family N-acetyltransferase [Blastocatellia bacterium]